MAGRAGRPHSQVIQDLRLPAERAAVVQSFETWASHSSLHCAHLAAQQSILAVLLGLSMISGIIYPFTPGWGFSPWSAVPQLLLLLADLLPHVLVLFAVRPRDSRDSAHLLDTSFEKMMSNAKERVVSRPPADEDMRSRS